MTVRITALRGPKHTHLSAHTGLGGSVFPLAPVSFLAFPLAAVVLIDSGYLAQTLGHPVGGGSYLNLVWLGSSSGIVAGALGASL